MAINTHRQLSLNNRAGAKSIEKLSSGYRINRAGDDAAGLAISEKMRSQIRGLNQASRNAQDDISLIQTAEGALNETHSIIHRMREIAVQSANDTNTDEDREALQGEMNQLAKEITRIANNTEFNTRKLLNGNLDKSVENSTGDLTFHIGANTDQNMQFSVNAMDAYTLGLTGAGQDPEEELPIVNGEGKGTVFSAGTITPGESTDGTESTPKAATAPAKSSGALNFAAPGITVNPADDFTITSNPGGATTTVNLSNQTYDGTAGKTGADLAADIQEKIRAVGGDWADYTVNYDGATKKLTITDPTAATGVASSLTITGDAATNLSFDGNAAAGTDAGFNTDGKDATLMGTADLSANTNFDTQHGEFVITVNGTTQTVTINVNANVTGVAAALNTQIAGGLDGLTFGAAPAPNQDKLQATLPNADDGNAPTLSIGGTGAVRAGIATSVGSSEDAYASVQGRAISEEVEITDKNSTMTITTDNAEEQTLTLPKGKYTAEALKDEINTAIQNNPELKDHVEASMKNGQITLARKDGPKDETSKLEVGGPAAVAAKLAFQPEPAPSTEVTAPSKGTVKIAGQLITATGAKHDEILNGVKIKFGADTNVAVAAEWDEANQTYTVTGDWDASVVGTAPTLADIQEAINKVPNAPAAETNIELSGIFNPASASGEIILAGGIAPSCAATFDKDHKVKREANVAAGIDIRTQKHANKAIATIGSALKKVSNTRAGLGAVQNRLNHTIRNLDVASENLQSSESRIRDVDMAKEMMNFTKNNILQQASQAMLAQANQAPQGVLQLLR